jgi:hypothetical protein
MDKIMILVLVDYQPSMFKSISSGDKTKIKSAAIGAAKAASILEVPVVLSAITPKAMGEFIPEITGIFPNQEVFARSIPGFDALEDERVWNAVKKPGIKKSSNFRIVGQHILCVYFSACLKGRF